jgi:ABC-type cobalamin transport system permease subunit
MIYTLNNSELTLRESVNVRKASALLLPCKVSEWAAECCACTAALMMALYLLVFKRAGHQAVLAE